MPKPRNTILAHEHLALAFFAPGVDPEATFAWTANSLKHAAQAGVEEIWDMSNQTLGRNLDRLARLADLTEISIVASTGHYLDPYHPPHTRDLTAAQIAQRWLADLQLTAGSVRVGVIGEIATGRGKSTDAERTAFEAAALVQRETGAPIYTHTSYGTLACWQIDVLLAAGASADHIVIGHADVLHPLSLLKEVAAAGAYLGIDTIGKESWEGLDGEMYHVSDTDRIELVRALVYAGYERQILLSSDLLYERGETALNPETFGRHGYSYVTAAFLPELSRSGLSERAVEGMARGNAMRLLHGS